MGKAALVLTGPTGVGKTELAIQVALELGAEIVSMDSRQVYRQLDIGTAKATVTQRNMVKHHGLDMMDPGERYSAGRFAADARVWVSHIRSRGRVPILVGGTGFFLRALTLPMFQEPPMPAIRREKLKGYLARKPLEELLRWQRVLDPATGQQTREESGGRHRVARALEVALLTGRTLAWWHAHAPPQYPPLQVSVFVLTLPREELYGRINQRVLDMVDQGFVEEAGRLVELGFEPDDPGLNATGYRDMMRHVRGELTLEEAIDAIQRATRRYARRQLTWLRNQLTEDAAWLDARRPAADLTQEIVASWRREAAA